MHYLVIRPEEKCERTCAYLTAHNISCSALPLMQLIPTEDAEQQCVSALSSVNNNDLILVTSTKAANIAANILKSHPQLADFSALQCYAVGQSSAALLASFGQFQSPEIETSEGLLALISQQLDLNLNNAQLCAQSTDKAPKPRRVIILKGEGGRETLKTAFQQVGCLVVECNLYRRQAIAPETTTSQWQQQNVDCIIATSGELMQNAFNCLPRDWLCSKHWIVVSERMQAKARDFGINKPIFVSRAANDAALLDAVRQFPED